MFSVTVALSAAAALLCIPTLTLAAPASTVTTSSTQSATGSSSSSTATLLPLYINGENINTTTYTPSASSAPANPSSSSSSPTPPSPYTQIDPTTGTNVTIVNQNAAVPSFAIPASDAQLFTTWAQAAYNNQSSSATTRSSSSLPHDGKLDIGAKLVNEPEDAGAHTVHLTVVRDPMTAKSDFTWAEGGVVVDTLAKWSQLWSRGSFVGCSGVIVQSSAGDIVAEGNFCGAKA